ncbi:MAG TPA: dienelactone hydrolase family protein [Smithella sp.]|nr:dienelactone hydrolase family protein [Smithella sp.]
MKKTFIVLAVATLILAICLPAPAAAKIIGKNVTYRAGDETMKGYLAFDEKIKGRRPGVLIVHEWWGQNEYVRKRARMIAKLGYVALALDMYGGGRVADHPDDAGKFAAEVMKNAALEEGRFMAALDYLKEQPNVDPERIAAIGYCFGGGVVLHMARQGVDLKGVASFHGSLATDKPAEPGVIKAKILVLNGDADKFTTPEQIESFKQEMDNAGADYQFISYPGAKHSFTNPDADKYAKKFKMPIGYNAAADKKSWAELVKFLAGIFTKRQLLTEALQ